MARYRSGGRPAPTADVLAVLAQPTRLAILHLLAGGPRAVGDLTAALGVRLMYVSAHLGVLWSAGVVEREKVADWMLRQRDGGTAGGTSIQILEARAKKRL